MTYKETAEWMFEKLPMYQQQGKTAYRKDLTNTLLLAEHLRNPEKNLKFIHIAGTNGKGSTAHTLTSILMEADYKVGLFTSPHLKDFRERIKIDGKEISEEYVIEFIATNKEFFEHNNLSFFEMTTGLALQYFKAEKVDIVVMETGMGGRLDSTNIITPIVSVITNIGLDHVQFLGDTLGKIAGEKAGIIKQDIPVVIGEYTSETKTVFEEIAKKRNAPIYFASDLQNAALESDLKGAYQKANMKTVKQTVAVINHGGQLKISDEACKLGMLSVVRNTGLLGRWQVLQQNPTVICDTAHNKHGLTIVLQQLQESTFDNLHIVLGLVNDKDLEEILSLFPTNAKYYFCSPNISRGLDVLILAQKAAEFSLVGNSFSSVSDAYKAAASQALPTDLIYAGGSTFVVAEILNIF
ncbi:bifunctional folylpolyglutamate synthase/dihydrofolate synthase [Flavobacterium ardleyense]|uniref:bifunctional folylpolyglutamate synthase/dihydrofolate synthase n=1 Tax=Flavobacterium ardleyense TaxID=2038737 RepID=UPI00298CD52F|nr:folylpolyglutamate synthase/dihydrofolate synthase family protein [Flavobacterium ardleyense]